MISWVCRASVLVVGIGVGLAGCTQSDEPVAAEVAPLGTELEKGSYQVGYVTATRTIEQFAGALDTEAFRAGLLDQLAGRDSRVSEEEARVVLEALFAEQQRQQNEAFQGNADKGAAYLAENGAREGVVTLESGLQYEILTDAEGPKPKATDQVTTHYEGKLIDGQVFDSSIARGTPATFPLNGVIKGWTEALQLMSVGSKWRIYLPPELAYGERGAPPNIPPLSTLVFEVELLGIVES